MQRLENSVAIITGAARGIGVAIAERCSAEGARSLLVDMDPAVADVASKIPNCAAFVADITERGSAGKAFDAAEKAFGPVTGLVNNAALVPELEKLLDQKDENWNQTLAVNLEAPMRWSQEFIRRALPRNSGSIVNIATIEANHVGPGGLAYHVSKAGLLALTRGITVEYGRQGIRCNSVSPGSIRSPRFDEVVGSFPGLEDALLSLNYAGRFGQPHEVAACVTFLLSNEAGYCNGMDMVIDGGRLTATLGPKGLDT
jgi:NAD(P)-dependent dehydrogenase (short-subunit alcohol dehydrogenase family)